MTRAGDGTRDTTKTGKTRTVTVPRSLAAEVATLLLPDPDAPIFRSPQGRVLNVDNWRPRFWRPAVQRALPPHLHALRIHDLRHTCASLLTADGWDVVAISRQLGHANPSVTMNIYTHVLQSHTEELRSRTEQTYAQTYTTGGTVLPLAR